MLVRQCALMHMLWKLPGFALIGACGLTRTIMVYMYHGMITSIDANRIADTKDPIWFYTHVSLFRLAKDLSLPNTYHIIG